MENFKKAVNMINKLQNNLYGTYEYFLIRDSLKSSIATNILGEEKALENLKIINRFIRFFGPSMEANRKLFALDLSKFFDKDSRTLSLYQLKEFLYNNMRSFNKNNFLAYNHDREYITKLADNYKPVDATLLNDIDTDILNNIDLIKKIKKFRDTHLAHNQIETEIISITVGEIKIIFKLVFDILNKISSRLNHNTLFGLDDNNHTQDETSAVLNYLYRFESYRVKEIENESKLIL